MFPTEKELDIRHLLQKYWNGLEEQIKKRIADPKVGNYTQIWSHLDLENKRENDFTQGPWTLCLWAASAGPCCLSSDSGPASHQPPLLLYSFQTCSCYHCDHSHHCSAAAAAVLDAVATATDASRNHENDFSFNTGFHFLPPIGWQLGRNFVKCILQSSHCCGKKKVKYKAER